MAIDPALVEASDRSLIDSFRKLSMQVGGSVAIRSGDVAGVYAVGTLEAARGRGVGSAATWACVRAAEDWGCHTVVLQSSEMGLGVYRAIGFETVVEYARYRLRQ